MLYFGHSVKSRSDETIGFLISRFGAVGYAVWFSLLEELAMRQDNLYIVFMTPQWLREFSASLDLDQNKIKEIIAYLAKKGLVNQELHEQKMLFSPNFLINHKDYLLKLYKNKENIKNIFFEKIHNRIRILQDESMFSITCEEIIQIQSRLILDLFQIESGVNPDSIQIESGVNPDFGGYIKGNKRKEKNINNYIPPTEKNEIPIPEEKPKPKEPEIVIPEIIEVPQEPEPPKQETFPKRTSKMFGIESEEFHIASKFAQEIKLRDRGASINIQGWAKDIFYMSNGRDRSEIEKVLIFALADPFWQSRIISPEKLFKNYTQLKSQMEKPNGNYKSKSDEVRNETLEQRAARYKALREQKAKYADPMPN